jgi:NADH-quinone oxidoreductase subunit A
MHGVGAVSVSGRYRRGADTSERAMPGLRGASGGTRARRRFSQRVSALVDLSQYLPILIFLGIALGLSAAFVFLPMGVARLTGTHNPNAEKLSEYECGFPAFEDPRSQFDVRFYLIAILFIVFDLEAAFLFPWAVSLDLTGWPGWITMMVFLFELAVGLAYAWKKGALEWE